MEASEARGGRAKPVADGERSATETRGGGRLAVWIRSIELWFSYFPTSTTTDSARQKRVIHSLATDLRITLSLKKPGCTYVRLTRRRLCRREVSIRLHFGNVTLSSLNATKLSMPVLVLTGEKASGDAFDGTATRVRSNVHFRQFQTFGNLTDY
jgi:hypothetical protein